MEAPKVIFDSGQIISTLAVLMFWVLIAGGGYLYSKLKYYEYIANTKQIRIEELKKELAVSEQKLLNCNAQVDLSKKNLKAIEAYYKKKVPFVITGKEPKDEELFNIEPK